MLSRQQSEEWFGSLQEVVRQFEDLHALTVDVNFRGNGNADVFMLNQAKWHKSCRLKFSPSKI